MFNEKAGTTGWYLFDLASKTVLSGPEQIIESIRSTQGTPRVCTTGRDVLKAARAEVEKHIKDTYLKRVDAPVGVKPVLKCWLELNEG